MRANFRFWFALSLLLVAGAILVRWKERSGSARLLETQAEELSKAPVKAPELLTTEKVLSTYLAHGEAEPQTPAQRTNRAPYQLSNVKESIDVLSRRDSAILMRNALIDTREKISLGIPAHLQATEAPGAYIVQSRGAKPGVFQKMLKDAGAEVVAYVPNNAYLVKADEDAAEKLRADGMVASLLPYEPYYKVDSRLMKAAVDQQPLDPTMWLRVTLFPGGTAETLRSMAREVGISENSPFGEQVLINPLSDGLAKLAQLPEVQLIEPWNPRVRANDLTRVRMGVSENQLTNEVYLNLRGSNVWLNINDIGVDGTHPDLTGRVFYHGTNANRDPDGHGTHVAATIIGSGATTNVFDNMRSNNIHMLVEAILTDDEGNPVSTNLVINGSPTNASMRGLAPMAKLFALPIDFFPDVNTPVTDSYIIETAARTNYFTLGRTNTLISNNSWNYANTTDYDSQAARFDAATRDALLTETGPHPVLYVFAAGNNGFGNEDGLGGDPGRISSPGTAKNVLTIGALETPRFILEGLTNVTKLTNEETDPVTITTNTNVVQIFLPTTDSQSEVASFSSRGNVGIGIEGSHGRFKPDLVAPGTFILSAKSKDWNLTNDFNPQFSETISNIYNVVSNLNSVSTLYRYDSGTSFAVPAVSGLLALVQEFFAERLPGNLQRNLSPALMKAMFINSARNVHERYDFEVENSINYQGWGIVNLKTVLSSNMLVKPEKDWHMQLVEQTPTNAVATGEAMTWEAGFTTNSEASGLRVTLVWTDPPGNPATGLKLVNDLDLVVEAGGRLYHGNDIISQRTATEGRDPAFDTVFGDSEFRDNVNNVENCIIPGGLGTNVVIHVIGRRVNVKSIHDVYAATGELNEIKQDFALVVESDYRGVDQNDNFIAPFVKFEKRQAKVLLPEIRHLDTMTNGLPLLNQRVGANSALYGTHGATNQWNFYVFTNNNSNVAGLNMGTPGQYVAFVTFTPPNLGIPRAIEADIDMYVSKNRQLTNLHPLIMSTAWRSRTRLGTEQVIFAPTNAIFNEAGQVVDRAPLYDPANPDAGGLIVGQANVDDVFYIAIKSEDQQGAEFSLVGMSSDRPFEEERNGIRVLTAMPASAFIPDGLPNLPKAATAIAIGLSDKRTLDASVFMTVSHEEAGDLVGVMRHNSTRAILNNHSLFNYSFTGTNSFIFTDDPYLDRSIQPDPIQFPFPAPPLSVNSYMYSDGPGLLGAYAGFKMTGPWIFNMIDNAFSHTGRLERLEVHIKPLQDPLLSGETIRGTVGGNSQLFYIVDVPPDGEEMTLILKQLNNLGLQLEMLVRRDLVPTTNVFDYRAVRRDPADSVTLTVGPNSAPPLTPGEYFVGIINRNAQAIDFELTMLLKLSSSGANDVNNRATDVALKDDARSGTTWRVNQDVVVTEASVAIVAENMRVSDYVFQLTSPQGTRVLLSENRGWFSTDGFGNTDVTTNALGEVFTGPSFAIFTDDPVAKLPIKFAPTPYGDGSTNRGALFRNGFDAAPPGNYAAPSTFDGWSTTVGRASVVNRPDGQSPPNYVNLAGTISRNIPTIVGRNYKLRFAYRGPGTNVVFNTGQTDARGLRAQGASELHYMMITNADPNFVGSDMFVAMTNQPPFPGWFPNSTNSQWIALSPANDNLHPPGDYVVRHTFVDNSGLGGTARVRFAGDGVVQMIFNGIPHATTHTGTAGFSPDLVGVMQPGLNTVDFLIRKVGVGPVGLRAEIELNSPVTVTENVATVTVIGNTSTNEYTVRGEDQWRIFETEFVANDANAELRFASIPGFPGLEIDSVEVIDTGTVFLQPEEPLAVLDGERAMGDWKLEAWDNRTGLTATVKDWQLLLSTARAVLPAEQMDAGLAFPTNINTLAVSNATYFIPGTTRGGEVQWFFYDVCPDASVVTITVTPASTNRGTLQLMVDRSGFPTADAARDDYPIQIVATNRALNFTLRTNEPSAAPLIQGGRVYFAIRNSSFFRTNSFEVLVTTDGSCRIPRVVPLPINSASVASDGNFQTSWASQPGASYEISVSTDLVNWTVVETKTAVSTETSYRDPEPADRTQKFYRIKPLP